MPVELFEYSVAILSCVLDIIMRIYGRHAGNYSRNRGHMPAAACRLPVPFISSTPQQAVLCQAITVPVFQFQSDLPHSWIMQLSRLSLNQCDLFWWVVRGMVVGFCSGRGIKIVNAHKKEVLLWGASWRAVFLLGKWCLLRAPQPCLPATGYMSCLQGPLGSGVQMVLFWIPLCDLETPGAAAPRCWL